MVIDPVCGMTVAENSKNRYVYDYIEYLFCSEHCLHKFKAHPQQYLKPAKAVEKAGMTANYTCPMHPEIKQQGPGACPKCGMALEPELPSLGDDDNPELRDFTRRFWCTLPLTVIVTVLAMFEIGRAHV